MTKEIITAHEIPVPHEVIALTRDGKLIRAVIFKKNLNLQQDGYRMNALGVDTSTGKQISLAPTTKVELGKPIVESV